MFDTFHHRFPTAGFRVTGIGLVTQWLSSRRSVEHFVWAVLVSVDSAGIARALRGSHGWFGACRIHLEKYLQQVCYYLRNTAVFQPQLWTAWQPNLRPYPPARNSSSTCLTEYCRGEHRKRNIGCSPVLRWFARVDCWAPTPRCAHSWAGDF